MKGNKNAMSLTRFIAPAAFLFTFYAANAQFTDVINSNRPGESMGAFSVGKTVIQAETGLYGIKEHHEPLHREAKGYGLDLAVRYGAFFEQLEFILEAQYQRDKLDTPLLDEKRNGFKQLNLGAKYLIYDPNKNYEKKPNLYSWKANHSFSWREFIPAVGGYAGFNFNLNNPYVSKYEESVSPKVMILTQNQFGKWVLVINLIGDKLLTNYTNLGYIVTLTRGFNYRWSGFIENQGYNSDQYTDSVLRGGAAFLIKENIQVDASIGTNFKDTPSVLYGGIGLSWRFDQNYEDVYLRVHKDEPKESKEDKKKKKEKKKRKDAIEETEPQP